MTTARRRLLRIRLNLLWRPQATSRQWIATAAAVLLGFGSVAAWRVSHSDTALTAARPEQLLAQLDSLNARQQRLQAEQRDLDRAQQRLENGSQTAALAEAKTRLGVLQVLAGTTPVQGPGVSLFIRDPERLIPASTFVDAIQELRDAGAEAIQVGPVRVVANSWFDDNPAGGINVSGVSVKPPYSIIAVGDAATMRTALGIPNGVIDSMKAAGASVRLNSTGKVAISAVVPGKPRAPHR